MSCAGRADELEIPFVASGGCADARSLVAAMALGREGHETWRYALYRYPGAPVHWRRHNRHRMLPPSWITRLVICVRCATRNGCE